MIVASLLLILVAVVLLVLGLAGGSSTLLISSIVASLLAAVALVIGARQATASRRAVGDPLPADHDDPPSASTSTTASATTSAARREPAARADSAASAESDRAFRAEPDLYAETGEPGLHSETALYGEPGLYAESGDHAESPLHADASSVGASSAGASSVGASSVGASSAGASSVGASSVGASFGGASSVAGDSAGLGRSGGVGSSSGVRTPSAPGTSDAEDAELSPGRPRNDHHPDGVLASDDEPNRAAAYAAGQRDTEAVLADRSRTAAGRPGPDVTQRLERGDEVSNGFDNGTDRVPHSGTDADRAATGRRSSDVTITGDYDQASSVIGGARAEDDESWRRAEAASSTRDSLAAESSEPGGASLFGSTEPPASWSGPGERVEPSWSGAEESRSASGSSWSAAEESRSASGASWSAAEESRSASGASVPREDGPLLGGTPYSAGAETAGRSGGATGEFGDPDPDDPDDEPLPQKVRPADAVRVARLDAEVMVVDGRPRYHVAVCPHLSGRQTEGLPVAEAVELGFSPCGQCRPVDRLVAAALRH